ncbi:MAG: radical SAM protein [Candidatus Sericytochromatia bacterium]
MSGSQREQTPLPLREAMRVGLLYVDDFQQPRSQRIGSLGLGYLAAWLQAQAPGCEVQIAISAAELRAWKPDLIGVSAYSETLLQAREAARELRALDVPLILGGAHMASNPLDLPCEFDAGVAGEGEEVLLQVVRLLDQNAFVPSHLQGIAGLTYQTQGQVIAQGRAPAIQDLDRLAHPDRRLMFAAMMRGLPDFQPILHIHTARGCPYRCSFCSAPLVNPQWRFHSPEWVIAELEGIAQQFPDITDITLSDDLFTLKKSRLEVLVAAIRAAGFHKRFQFFCSSRSNTLTPDMCRLLRDMNVLMVSFGFESASDRLVRDLKGVGTHHCDYERVLDLCERFGIYAHGNFITGAQDETAADLHQTYAFVQRNLDRLASVYFSHMTPFPGTRVWSEAEQAGLIPAELDYRVLNLEYERGSSVFLNQHYSEDFYQHAYTAFKGLEVHLNDRYYKEQAFLRELSRFERQEWPEFLLQTCDAQGWQQVAVIASQETHLPADPRLLEMSPAAEIPATAQAVVLYYVLDELRDPAAFLARLPQHLPVLSLNHNAGFYYSWVLLLLGKWEEGIYGLRRRRNVRYFTSRSLRRLFDSAGYLAPTELKHRSSFSPDPTVLKLLNLIGKPVDVEIHSLSSLFLPQVKRAELPDKTEFKPSEKELNHAPQT